MGAVEWRPRVRKRRGETRNWVIGLGRYYSHLIQTVRTEHGNSGIVYSLGCAWIQELRPCCSPDEADKSPR